MKINILIPVYNEEKTIDQIINKILKLKNINKEILIINDGSSDNTKKKILKYKNKTEFKIFEHKVNLGKGSAIKTAQKHITGDIVIIQDADLEYDPKDYYKLIKPIALKKTKVVYGSRVLGKNRYNLKNFTSITRIFFNHVLTIFSNIINKQNLTDAHTCYKVFSADIFKKIDLKEKGFAFCPEITTKISNLKLKIIEVPIDYNGRTYSEGKKISYKDGIEAILAILKYKFNEKKK